MSKKQLTNRIQSLFEDLSREVPLKPSGPDRVPAGWAWECDSQGHFIDCGDEIASVLGFSADELSGKSLTSFALETDSKLALQEALRTGKYPITIDLQYHTTNQHTVAVRTEIYPIPWNDRNIDQDPIQIQTDAILGWRGFSRVKSDSELRQTDEPTKQAQVTQDETPGPAPVNQTAGSVYLPELQPSPPSLAEPPIAAPSWPTYKPARPSGFRAEERKVHPASSSLTPAGQESLLQKRPIAKYNQPDEPAVLALSTLFEDGNSNLLLEFLDEDPYRAWSENERLLVEQVADQLSLALENARLFEQTQLALSETAVLYQASAELSAAQDYSQILATLQSHTIAGNADKLLSLVLFNRPWAKNDIPESNRIIAHWTSLPVEKLSEEYPLKAFPSAVQLLSATTATVVEDVQGDSRLDEGFRSWYSGRFQAASTIFVPLVVAGQWIGFINGVYGLTTKFEDSEIRRLMSLSRQAAVAVQNLSSIQLAELRAREAQKRSEELALVNRIVTSVAGTLDLHLSLEVVASEIGKALNVMSGIALLDSERQAFKLLTTYSPDPNSYDVTGAEIFINDNPAIQKVILTRQTQLVEDPQHNPDVAPLQPIIKQRAIEAMMILPLLGSNQVNGIVCLDSTEPGRIFQAEEIRLAETIVLQAATAIQNAQLFDQTELALADTETLYQASAELNATENYEQILDILRQYSILGQDAQELSISLLEREHSGKIAWGLPIAAWSNNYDPEPQRLALSPQDLVASSELLQADVPTIITDIASDARLSQDDRNLLQKIYQVKSVLIAPMVVSGVWLGHILAAYQQEIRFNSSEIRRMMTLVGQAAVAIQNLHLLEETRLRNEELAAINSVIAAASRSLELNEMLQEVLTQALETVDFEMGLISLFDPESHKLYLAVQKNLPDVLHQKLSEVGLDGTLCDLVYRSGQTLTLRDMADAAPMDVSSLLKLGLRSYLGAPLVSKGETMGTICIFGRLPESNANEKLSLIQAIGQQVGAAIENARAYELSQKAVEEMREVDRLKSQFLANMSHELRTPLNSIIGFSRVILKGIDGPINDVQGEDLTAIYNSGQHLLNLINDVLDLSKIEAGKLELAFEDQVNLSDLIQSVMSTVVGLVKDKPIKLVKDLAPDLPVVRADPTKIRQILINLFSNAAKFTEQGAITIAAYLQIGPKGHPEVLLKVSDTGPGIAPVDQARLFQPFSQVDASLTRKTGGTGLGLSICRHLVEMHHGRIGLESELGKGSSFYFTLPVSAPEPEPWDTEAARVVLAIDDERPLIQLYERYLAPHGYRVLALSDPTDAVKRAQEVEPYAILLDVLMPGRDGWQVLKDLRANPATAAIPVIMCSIQEYQKQWQELGANAYLTKPVLEEDLMQALEDLSNEAHVPSVLVLADDPNNLSKIASLFGDTSPYQIRQAIGGTQALKALDYKLPDVILLTADFGGNTRPDTATADIDWFTLLETLHANPKRSTIPILILTETDLDQELRSRLAHFSPEMLLKVPIQSAELLACIEHSLQLRAYPNSPTL
jgi:signal transduction histidine kinase/DNA-binding response OmpR family regulator